MRNSISYTCFRNVLILKSLMCTLILPIMKVHTFILPIMKVDNFILPIMRVCTFILPMMVRPLIN